MLQASIFEVQITLIGLGLFFQLMAYRTNREAKPVYPDGHDLHEEEKPAPPNQLLKNTVPQPAHHSSKPHQPVRDCYGIEPTEPGVRPGELLRTAKVSYFNDVNVKPLTKK